MDAPAPNSPSAAPGPSIRLPHWGWFLLATVVLLAGYGVLALWWPYQREQQAVRMFKRTGAYWHVASIGGPRWLRDLLGPERVERIRVFYRVDWVRLGSSTTDADVGEMAELNHVWSLGFDCTQITDAALDHLPDRCLEYLYLSDTKITDAGLAHLGEVTSLEGLDLDRTQLTDSGLAHLTGLTHLNHLRLDCTQVTDSGLALLAGLNLEKLTLDDTRVTDTGLAHLARMRTLRELSLWHTQVTDDGLLRLAESKSLESLTLDGTEVTDEGLRHLRGLTTLEFLSALDTDVTDAGVAELQRALPGLTFRRKPPRRNDDEPTYETRTVTEMDAAP